MSKTLLPFAVKDVSGLARSIARELASGEERPGHVQILNILARAAGFRNFQHFRAARAAEARLDAAPPLGEPVDHVRVERVARLFDAEGRLTRWPPKANQRRLCLWVLWSRFPVHAALDEIAVNAHLNRRHSFGDPALMRRELVDGGFVRRTVDGREYRRIECRPEPDALALFAALKPRFEAADAAPSEASVGVRAKGGRS